MTPLAAKFERERKAEPKHWAIRPTGKRGQAACELVYIGPRRQAPVDSAEGRS